MSDSEGRLSLQALAEIPREYLCPISLQPMTGKLPPSPRHLIQDQQNMQAALDFGGPNGTL